MNTIREPSERRKRSFPGPPIHSRLLEEEQQRPIRVRQRLLKAITAELGTTAVSFFTSFVYPVMIEERDADMLEDVLQHTDLSKGLCLIINSPGGLAVAAERIVRVCRTYGRGSFSVLVPRRAKSAATMIALGSTKLHMTETSELGPISTQVIRMTEEGAPQQFSAHSLIKSYDDLMRKAETTTGHMEPYLLQLQSYDAAEIEELRASEDLAQDIAVRWLGSGMMAKVKEDQIKRRIGVFLDPEITKVHGRGIFYDECKATGLNVELIPNGSRLSRLVAELFERTEMLVNGPGCKVVESAQYHFVVPVPLVGEGPGPRSAE